MGLSLPSKPPVMWRFYGLLTIILAALAATEYAFVFIQGALGVIMSVTAAVSIYAGVSIWKIRREVANIVEDIALLFIYILLITSLPWFFFNNQTLIPAVYTLVLSLCFWRIYSQQLSFKDVGLVRSKPTLIILGAFGGVPLGIIEYFVLRTPPLFPVFQLGYFAETSVYMVVFVALGEELLFRGLIQTSLAKYIGPWPALVIQAAIFSIMHTVWRSPLEIVFTFAAGLVLGYTYKRTGSLAPGIAIHTLDNVLLLAVMPYLF